MADAGDSESPSAAGSQGAGAAQGPRADPPDAPPHAASPAAAPGAGEEQQHASPSPEGQPAQPAAALSGWGGWGAALNLASKVQQAALGAVKEVRGLTDGLAEAIAEATADKDEVEDLAKYQAPAAGAEASSSGAGAMANPPAAAVADRSAPPGGAVDPDAQLHTGLQAIDDSVEQLATGAVKALGGLWSGLTNSVLKVEAAALGVAEKLVDSIEEAGQPLLQNARGTLQTLLAGGGKLLGSSAADAVSFDKQLYIFGGVASFDELESISSQCAHICNRARATLGPQHAAKLEAALQDLAPYFDWAAAQAAPSVGEEEGRRVEACGAALAGAYRPLAALVKRSQRKAQEFAASMPPPPAPGASSAAPGASPGAASSQAAQGAAGDAAGGAAGDAAGDAGADSAAAAEAEAAAREEAEEQLQLVQAWLHAVHAAAVRALAEAAAGHLDACLGHARSLSAPARFGAPLDDGFDWPAGGAAAAHLLRTQADQMASDLQVVTGAFKGLLPPLAGAADGQLLDAVQQLGVELDGSCQAAAERVREAFRGLMSVVWLAAVHRDGLAEAPAAGPADEAPAAAPAEAALQAGQGEAQQAGQGEVSGPPQPQQPAQQEQGAAAARRAQEAEGAGRPGDGAAEAAAASAAPPAPAADGATAAAATASPAAAGQDAPPEPASPSKKPARRAKAKKADP